MSVKQSTKDNDEKNPKKKRGKTQTTIEKGENYKEEEGNRE